MFTIIIPIALIKLNIEINIYIVPLFILLYLFFKFLNNNAHKLYLEKTDKQIENEIEKERKTEKHKIIKTIKYGIILIIVGVVLYILGDLLGENIEVLCKLFNIPEVIIGILLGIVTSLPELITFHESQKHNNKINDQMLGVVEATNNLLTSNIVNLFVIQTIAIILMNLQK